MCHKVLVFWAQFQLLPVEQTINPPPSRVCWWTCRSSGTMRAAEALEIAVTELTLTAHVMQVRVGFKERQCRRPRKRGHMLWAQQALGMSILLLPSVKEEPDSLEKNMSLTLPHRHLDVSAQT